MFSELEKELLPSQLSLQNKQIVLHKLRRFEAELSRNRVDFKCLNGFKDYGLLELRFSLFIENAEIPVRLIMSELAANSFLALCWHRKDPTLSLDLQRAKQNKACKKAIRRLRSM